MKIHFCHVLDRHYVSHLNIESILSDYTLYQDKSRERVRDYLRFHEEHHSLEARKKILELDFYMTDFKFVLHCFID